MATHSSVLVWRIPGMVEPGGLPSMEVTQNWSRLKRLSSRSSSLLVWTCEILFYWTDCNPLLLLFISMVKLSKIWPVDSCVLLAVPVILSLSLSLSFFGVVLGLYCSTWASLAAAHRLSCPAACRILVPRPGIEPASPALEGRFFTTAPPGKSLPVTLLGNFFLLLPQKDVPGFSSVSTTAALKSSRSPRSQPWFLLVGAKCACC